MTGVFLLLGALIILAVFAIPMYDLNEDMGTFAWAILFVVTIGLVLGVSFEWTEDKEIIRQYELNPTCVIDEVEDD